MTCPPPRWETVPYLVPYNEVSVMRKTSIYLSPAEEARLRELARLTGKSQSEIVREAIESYRVPDRNFAMLNDHPGEGGPGDSMADHLSKQLLKGFGE